MIVHTWHNNRLKNPTFTIQKKIFVIKFTNLPYVRKAGEYSVVLPRDIL